MKLIRETPVTCKGIVIDNASELDHILTPNLYGVTSSESINGATEFFLAVIALGSGAYDIAQMQIAFVNGSMIQLTRSCIENVFGEWVTPDLTASTRPDRRPGFSMLDTNLGKPVWLKSVGPDVHEVCKLTVTEVNVREICRLAVGAVNTNEVCRLTIGAVNVQEICTLTCGAAVSSGTVTVTLNDVAKAIELTAGDTAADVAETIAAKTFVGWTQTVEGNIVTFTKDVAGACTAPAFEDTDTTSTTGTFVVTDAGSSIVSGTLTITLNGEDIPVEVSALDSAAAIATKIQQTAFAGWAATVLDNVVTFTKAAPGVCSAPAFADTDTTGATGVITVTTEGEAVAAGTLTITLNGEDVPVEIAAADSAAAIAIKIQQTAFAGWAATVLDNVVTFTKAAPGVCTAPAFTDTDSTGATGNITVTTEGFAVSNGTLTITLDSEDVPVEIAAADSSTAIASKIEQTAFAGWTVTVDRDVVTFTKEAIGANSAPEFDDTDTTGAVGTFTVTIPGSSDVWVDATGTEV